MDINKLRRRLEFRGMILKISRDISNSQCEELLFLYERQEKLEPLKPLQCFDILIQNRCVEDHKELLEHLQFCLDKVGREDLAKIVADFIEKTENNFSFEGTLTKEELSRVTCTNEQWKRTYLESQPPEGEGTVILDDISDSTSGRESPAESQETPGRSKQEEHFTKPEDKKYMKLAEKASMKSTDPDTQVGAVIIDSKGEVVSEGWNCMPEGCEGKLPWSRSGETQRDTKYPYVVHAIEKGIFAAHRENQSERLQGATIYTTLFPGHHDAKMMIESGIKELIYQDDKYIQRNHAKIAKKLMDTAGIEYRQYVLP